MANDNHEYYNSDPICTYTDAITVSNPMSADDVYASVLAAGVPYGRDNCAWIRNDTTTALNEPNANGPWENGPSGVGVVHDTSALIDIPVDNPEKYFHVLYKAGNNGTATDLSVKKYRNVVAITTNTTTIYGNTITYYSWTITTQYGDEEEEDWTNSTLSPYRVINISGDPCLLSMSGDQNNFFGNSEFSAFGGRSCIGHYSVATSGTNGATVTPLNAPYVKDTDWDYEMVSETDYQIYNDEYTVRYLYAVNYGGGGGFHAYGAALINSIDYILMLAAICGLKFEYNGTTYKPIVSGGVVTGYTDDMTEESEWDEWENIGDHTIPDDPTPVPPPPGADDDNTDPISTTGAPFASGLAHYYAMTADSVLLAHVSEALGTWDIDTSKKDLYRNLISCKLVKPPAPIPVSGSEDFTIYGVVPQYQGAGVKLPVINGNPTATFGPYSISRKFNDFRDYAPYTKAEIYLPYCGWCALPSHVVGRSVTVHYYTDIIAATCKAIVFCNNNVVAEAAGVIGLDIPFAAENVGAKMEAVNAGLLATASGGVQLAAGVGSMVSTKSSAGLKGAASGLSQYISGYTQMAMAFNENWTEISGKNGDGCAIAGITNIIIKITRPKYGTAGEYPYVPAGYAHNVGYVSNKQITVGSASGLLICDNADTSGISGATDAERAEIKRVLETGIYVNSPPE